MNPLPSALSGPIVSNEIGINHLYGAGRPECLWCLRAAAFSVAAPSEFEPIANDLQKNWKASRTNWVKLGSRLELNSMCVSITISGERTDSANRYRSVVSLTGTGQTAIKVI